jgi:hypothetical protein
MVGSLSGCCARAGNGRRRTAKQRDNFAPVHDCPIEDRILAHRSIGFMLRSQKKAADVRYGSKADIGLALVDVRYSPKSGH